MKTTISRRSGFTLLELLVVIGIIGVLVVVTISQFGGVTGSAKATTCMTNMRNLALATYNTAMENEYGHFPAAGSYKWKLFNRRLTYPTHKGWISWSTMKDNPAVSSGGSAYHFTDDQNMLRNALTNGAIWRAVGCATKAYQCPVHAEACLKQNKRYPGWSYVMNQEFGYDADGTPKPNGVWKTLEGMKGGERTLLFAEIQGVTINDAKQGINVKAVLNGSGNTTDCVLQYESENIGFNHQISGKKWVAHVAFADGHVSQLLFPRHGLTLQELTKALCQGKELMVTGNKYEESK